MKTNLCRHNNGVKCSYTDPERCRSCGWFPEEISRRNLERLAMRDRKRINKVHLRGRVVYAPLPDGAGSHTFGLMVNRADGTGTDTIRCKARGMTFGMLDMCTKDGVKTDLEGWIRIDSNGNYLVIAQRMELIQEDKICLRY